MSSPCITVVDFGAGNLNSVVKAIRYLGYEPRLTHSPQEVLEAEVLILPGVGAAPAAMAQLKAQGLVEPLTRFISSGRPFLGICLGMQLLFSFSQEGNQPCLDILPGRVKRLPAGLKVPHMGWNLVVPKKRHHIFSGIPDPAYFYFVHSYYPEPENPDIIAGETSYGATFSSIIIRDNLVATQFHPEKSGQVGLKLYANFLAWAGTGHSSHAS